MEQFNLSPNVDTNKVFLVNKSQIEKRLDPQQFHFERLDMINRLNENNKLKKLKYVVENISLQVKNPNGKYIGLENIISNIGCFVETQEKESISSAKVFCKGDVLFPKLRPYLNKVYYAEFDGFCSTEFYVFRFKDEVINEFLSIYLRSNIILNQTKNLMTGNTLPRLQTEDVDNLPVPILDIDIQKNIINKYNDAFENYSKSIKLSEKILESINQYLLDELGIELPVEKVDLADRIFITQYSEVVGSRYDSYFHQHHFKEFQNNLKKGLYPVVRLRDLVELITSGITPKSGGDAYVSFSNGIPFIRSGDININGELNYSNLLYIREDIHNKEMKSSKLKKNDLMIAIVGATIGQVGIYLDDCEANINQAIALVRLKKGLNPLFFKELIKSSIGQWNLNHLKRPVARANINLDEISTMMLVVPPLEKQQEIVTHIQNLRHQAKQLEQDAEQILADAKREIERVVLGE